MTSLVPRSFVRNLWSKQRVPIIKDRIENTDKAPFLLLASIGNPEKSYKGTRHSVGHFVLKEIARREGFTDVTKLTNSSYYSNKYKPNMLLYESTSFMNTSGKNIKDAWNNILNSSKAVSYNPVLVVLHDELDLSLGKIKIKKRMSSPKGHNGLKSINNYLGGQFLAISIGISRPESRNSNEVADYVLSKFPSSELSLIRDQVVDKVEIALQEMAEEEKYIYEVNGKQSKKGQK